MNSKWITQILLWLRWGIATVPLLFSMYTLYYLGKHEIWIPQTPHRDKITIFVLLMGMSGSLLSITFFSKCNKTGSI